MRIRSQAASTLLALGLGALVAAPLLAQQPAAPAQAPCTAPEYRQFDFWAGEWDVTQPDGTPAGTNRIDIILGGCVLQENWRSASGQSVGHSFSLYGRDGKWHQTWVDNSGLLLEIVGGVGADGRMVMTQDTTGADGQPLRHELSWEKLPTGQVKQHWRTSRDAGQTWADAFVGIYTRRP